MAINGVNLEVRKKYDKTNFLTLLTRTPIRYFKTFRTEDIVIYGIEKKDVIEESKEDNTTMTRNQGFALVTYKSFTFIFL